MENVGVKEFDTGVYSPIWTTNKRYTILEGSAGSGKSTAIAFNLAYRAMKSVRKVLCARKIYATCKDSQFEDLKKALDFYNATYEATTSPLRINLSNGSKFIFKGADSPDKLKSVSDIDTLWMEEADQFDVKDFVILDSRIRNKFRNNRIYLSYNPLDCWIYETLLENPDYKDSILYLKTTWKDNESNLSKSYIDSLLSYESIDPYYYRVYCLGERGEKSTDKVFSKIKLGSMPVDPEFTCYGVDWGMNDKSTIVKAMYQNGTWYIKELLYKGMTRNELVNEVKSKVNDKSKYIFVDPSCPDVITPLHQAGYNVTRARNSIQEGIRELQSSIIVTDTESRNLITEWNNYRYDRDPAGKIIDKPKSNQDDHAIDSARYAIYGAVYNNLIEIRRG